tara:strand:- start:14 stop:505 length:492 start_codon:yes stop_codon:yes gene_type:complete
MQQFMTGEQVARMSLRGGENLWIPYSREEIVGEYDFSVQAGSTQPMNETIRKQQAISLMNAVAPMIGTVIDPAAIAMHILETGFNISDPERFLLQQPPPDVAAEDGQMPPEESGPPQGNVPPDMGNIPMPPAPDMGAFAPTGGIPPELLAQLQGQMGVQLPSL